MESELSYLLTELDKHPDNQVITIKDLKLLIQNAFEMQAVIEQSLTDINDFQGFL